MIDLQFINAAGDTMNAIHNEYMTLIEVEGLHGVDNEMSSSTSPYFDGDFVDHVRTNPRTIALTYHLTTPIPDALRYFNRIVKSKQKATLIETQEDGKQIKIEGIVTVPTYSRWSNAVAVQIQLYCSKPYWKDVAELIEELTGILDLHYFPFETAEKLEAKDGGLAFPEEGVPFGAIETDTTKVILNDGDIPVGAKITIVALDTVTNPVIMNNTTGDWLQINATLNSGDYVEINTERGEKEIVSNNPSVDWNSISYNGSDWLQLATGYNELTGSTSEAGNNNIYFSIQCVRGWQ